MMDSTLVIDGVSVAYDACAVVHEVRISVPTGRMLALVGESGSGKTTLGLTIARLLPPGGVITAGHILVGEVDMTALAGDALRQARGRVVAYLPQDAMSALNPLMRVGDQVAEVLWLRAGMTQTSARHAAAEALREMGIAHAAEVTDRFPHELSGGERQRVMLAIALAGEPAVLVADEPTTALDVTVQADILRLVTTVQRERGLTVLWITHDLGVVADIADTVAVLYGGRVVEYGSSGQVLAQPQHRYTDALLACFLAAHSEVTNDPFATIPGGPPSAGGVPSGCPFHPRCAHASERCSTTVPELVGDEHLVACHHPVGRGGR